VEKQIRHGNFIVNSKFTLKGDSPERTL